MLETNRDQESQTLALEMSITGFGRAFYELCLVTSLTK